MIKLFRECDLKQTCFSVQYHPEAAPGPNDAQHLFEAFYQLVSEAKAVSKFSLALWQKSYAV